MTMTIEQLRADFISALGRLANILEANPGIPQPCFGTAVIRCSTLQEMRAIAKSYGGTWVKEDDPNDFQMRREFGPGMRLLVYASHEAVCKKIVTGKRVIPEHIIPASEERVIPEHEEEIVEWHCPEVLNGTESRSE